MNKHSPAAGDAGGQISQATQIVEDAPDYLDAMQAKRRALRRSLAGAGGLSPGIHGIMTTDEDVFGERQYGPEPNNAPKKG